MKELNSNSTPEDHQIDDLDLDFEIDRDPVLGEIGSQLHADAKHLTDVYPSGSGQSSRLEDLVSRCQAVAQESNELVTPQSVHRSSAPTEKESQPMLGGLWLKSATAVLLLAIVLALPYSFSQHRPLQSSLYANSAKSTDQTVSIPVVTPVVNLSVSEDIRQATAPELEAFYDSMPTDAPCCLEF